MLRGLHKVCDKGQWESSLSRLATHSARSSAMEKGGWGGWTPLHLACKRDPPLNVIMALIDVAPETAYSEDSSQRHPIHHAAEWGAHVEILAALYDAHPASVGRVDAEGRTPLHLSILGSNRDSQQRREVPSLLEVELLLDGDCVAEKVDIGGNLALHCACDNIDGFVGEKGVKSIKAMVNGNRAGLTTRNAEGQTPLHLSLLKCEENPPSLELVKVLIGSSKGEKSSVARMEDTEGRLPLHCACKNFASFEVLNELLIHCPEAAGSKCLEGTYPLDVLEEMRESICTTDEMEEMNYKSDLIFAHYPNILPYRKDAERLRRLEDLIVFEAQHHGGNLSVVARNIWLWLCTFPETEDPDGLYGGTVKNVTERVKETSTVRLLANIETKDGVAVRHVASAKCKRILQPLFRYVDRFEFMSETSGLMAPLHQTETSIIVRLKDHEGVEVGEEARVIAMRLESNRDKFNEELSVYEQLGDAEGVLPMLENYDMDRVNWREEKKGDAQFARSVKETRGNSPYDLTKYRHAFVFPPVDRILEGIWPHEQKKKGWMKDKEVKRQMLEVGKCLKNFHVRNVIDSIQ